MKPSKSSQKRQRKKANEALRDASRGLRLQKALARAGVASRRQCEHLIEHGHVRVNGHTVTKMPAWIDPQEDIVEVDHQRVDITQAERRIYLAVYKPKGVICTNHDPEGRRRVFDLVPYQEQLHCVGRLDGESFGLILLTNDGKLTQQLTHPRYGIPKTYLVTVSGRVTPEDIAKLQRGIWLADKTGDAFKVQSSAVTVINKQTDRTQLQVILREGRNREIRRMMARLGFRVKKLQRVAIGPLSLKGLKSGGWRELNTREVNGLKNAVRKSRQSQARRAERQQNKSKPTSRPDSSS